MLYRNYQLNKTHSALKFGRADGYPLVLSNAKSAPVRKLEVSGNSYQATRGKNLFNVDAITSTYGGYVENGTIYVTGYPYETGITPEKFLEMTELKEGDTFTTDLTYTQFGDTTNKTWGTMRFASKVSGVSNLDLVSKGTGITSTIPKNFNSSNYTSIYIYSGNAPEEGDIRSTCENMAVYKGAYTADTMPPYEPYVKMPSPDHPSEIVGVGDKTANLLYKDDVVLGQALSCGGVGSNYGHLKGNYNFTMYFKNYDVKPNTKYTMINYVRDTYWMNRIIECDENDLCTWNHPLYTIDDSYSDSLNKEIYTFTTKAETKYILIQYMRIDKADVTEDDVYKLHSAMLEGTYTADTMPEYEPYGYRVPIECRGRNLFDKNKYKNIYDYVSDIAPYYYCVPIKLMPKTKYTVSFKRYNWDGKGHHRLMIRAFNGDNVVVYVAHSSAPSSESTTHTYTTGDDGLLYIATYSTDKVTQSDLDFIWEHCDVQIEEGNTATAYEPFAGETKHIYIDKPLYGIDDYTDSITLDFEKKKAVRTDRVKEIMLSTEYVYRKCENVIRFAIRLTPYLSYKGARMMCNGLKCLAEGKQAYSGNFECLFMHDSFNNNCYFSLNKTRIGAEDTDTDSQLVEKANAYLADNPITAYYKLGTPIETDISDTVDWDKLLHLSRYTDILSSSTTISPSNLYIKYIRK